MTLVASLGMYDAPPQRAANDGLWSAIAGRLTERGVAGVPRLLDRERPLHAIWSDPDLLLAQCCGYPLATRYRDSLRYVATPRYAAPGCRGAYYRSRIVVRGDDPAEKLTDLRGRRAAVNEWQSNSGMNLFRTAIAPLAGGAPFFAAVIETGSHAASIRAVANGGADVAAIDAVSFAHAARGDPPLAACLRTIGWTDEAPGLPLVTAITTSDAVVALLRDAIGAVMRDARVRAHRDALLIEGVERLPDGAYDTLLRMEREAVRRRYPALA